MLRINNTSNFSNTSFKGHVKYRLGDLDEDLSKNLSAGAISLCPKEMQRDLITTMNSIKTSLEKYTLDNNPEGDFFIYATFVDEDGDAVVGGTTDTFEINVINTKAQQRYSDDESRYLCKYTLKLGAHEIEEEEEEPQEATGFWERRRQNKIKREKTRTREKQEKALQKRLKTQTSRAQQSLINFVYSVYKKFIPRYLNEEAPDRFIPGSLNSVMNRLV